VKIVNFMRNTSQQYFYHPDHLGSSSFISDASGEACQFLAYLPFGEQWVDQRSSGSYDAHYKFSGKEKDEETGYNYFGARYYDSGLSVWLSVDPLAVSYPEYSPYQYCAGSPLNCVDPDGQRINWICFIGAFKSFCDNMGTEAGRNNWKEMRKSDTWYTFRYTRAVLLSENYDGTYSVLNGQMVTSYPDELMIYRGRARNGLVPRKVRPVQIQISTGSYDFWKEFDVQIPENATHAQKAELVEKIINSGDYKLKVAARAFNHGRGIIILKEVKAGELNLTIGQPAGGVPIAGPLPNESKREYRQRVNGHEAGHGLQYKRDRENNNPIDFEIVNERSAQKYEGQVTRCQENKREK
jgi:RHS repeat-associated protein